MVCFPVRTFTQQGGLIGVLSLLFLLQTWFVLVVFFFNVRLFRLCERHWLFLVEVEVKSIKGYLCFVVLFLIFFLRCRKGLSLCFVFAFPFLVCFCFSLTCED